MPHFCTFDEKVVEIWLTPPCQMSPPRLPSVQHHPPLCSKKSPKPVS